LLNVRSGKEEAEKLPQYGPILYQDEYVEVQRLEVGSFAEAS
jgi:hypothetical protein